MEKSYTQLELPLYYPYDLMNSNTYYVTFKQNGYLISGKVIGCNMTNRGNAGGDFTVDPGGSGANLFYADWNEIVNIEEVHSETY
jgi:hypothetical protein